MAELENINPNVYKKTDERRLTKNDLLEEVIDPIDEREVFGKHLATFCYCVVSSWSFLLSSSCHLHFHCLF